MTKAHADAVLRAVLLAEHGGWFKAEVMFLAVVVGGGSAYRTDQARARTSASSSDDGRDGTPGVQWMPRARMAAINAMAPMRSIDEVSSGTP